MTLEEFDVDGGPSLPGVGPAPAPERPWRWVAVAALLVTVGGIAAPAHHTTDGINLVASLSMPPTLAWEAPVADLGRPSARLEAEVVDGVVAVTTDAGVTGYDAVSGAMLWDVAMDRGRCTYQERVVCATGRGWSARVVAVDPRTGSVEETWLPNAAWALQAEDDLVALLYSRRTQSVVRIGDDGIVWSTEVPYQPGIGGAARGYPFARIADRLYVGTAGPAVLDLDTGITIERPLLLRYDDAGIYGLGFNETWWHLWSGERVTLHEGAARLSVDDDISSATDVLVSAATGITQLREGVDEPYWSGVWGETPLARLAGVLVTVDDGEADSHGIDLESGQLLWTDELMSCPCLGSGDVLVVSSSATVPAGLTAIDVGTGLPVWQLAFPAATHMVTLVDDGVLVAGTDRVLLYRW